MKRAPVLLSALISLSGCTSRSSSVSALSPGLVDSRPAIVFIPGFYGSALRERKSGRRIFLTGFQAFFGSAALSLYQSELATPPGPELKPEGVLGSVSVIPGLYELELYAPLLRSLREARPDAQILPLAYDWREDPFQAVEKLDELLRLLETKGCREVHAVAHSLGGLVLSYHLAYGNQPPAQARISWAGAKLIRSAVLFGVPFGGAMMAFRSFEKGSALPHSGRLLPADAMSSFPGLYSLLPGTSTLYDRKGSPITLDLFDFALWKQHRWGLLRRPGLSGPLLDSREHFTRERLAGARLFSERLQLGQSAAWQPPPGLRVLNVMGRGTPTLHHAFLDGGKLFFDGDAVPAAGLKADSLFSPGDGSVALSSAAVPSALESSSQLLLTEYPHEQLFLDPAVEKEYKTFLSTK